MMKIRRLIAVVLLIVVVLLVGYSCYTGNRLTSPPDNLDGYKRYVFRANDGTRVAFMDENVWYGIDDEPMVLLEIDVYQEGVISMQREGENYEFVAIDDVTIYDCQAERILIRRGAG